jgi:hypothetical protein
MTRDPFSAFMSDLARENTQPKASDVPFDDEVLWK